MKRVWLVALAAALILCGCSKIPEGNVSSAAPQDVSSQETITVDKTEKVIQVPDESAPNWALFLVNNYNQLPDGYEPQLATVADDRQFHHKAAQDFQNMLDAAEEEGYTLYVVSTYRSIAHQKSVLERDINSKIAQGMSPEEARAAAEFNIQKPGKSEHNTGLAADIVSSWAYFEEHNLELTEDFDQTPEYAWLSQHAHEYGFILRYPKDKEEITEITYEPWHYRYVGIENAKKIKDSGLCLEEYLSVNK